MYSSMARRIKKMIEKNGALVVHEFKAGPPVYNPSTRTNVSTPGSQNIHVIIDTTSLVSLGEIYGPDLVMSGDLNVSFHAMYDHKPSEGDFVTVDGERREMMIVKPIHFKKGEIVMYKALCRSGQRSATRSSVI